VDVRDFAILTHLLARPFDSFERVGRAAGMTGAAAKARVARLQEEGFLSAFHCIPAPEVVGRTAHGHLFVAEPGRMRVADVLAADSVVTAVENSGGRMSVISYSRPGDPTVPPELLDALGEPLLTAAIRVTRLDARRATLGPLDWRVMRALVHDPRASVTDLAAVVGLTRRTVARRREALLNAGAIRTMPALSEANARGLVIAHFFVLAESATAAGRALQNPARVFPLAEFLDPPGVSFATVAPTLGEIVEVEQAIRAFPGVLDVGWQTPLHVHVACERVTCWIEEQEAVWNSRSTPR